jgi:hypothetical protein
VLGARNFLKTRGKGEMAKASKIGVSVHLLSDFDIADARRLQMGDWFISALLP